MYKESRSTMSKESITQVWFCPYCHKEFRYFHDIDEEEGLGHHLYMAHESKITKRKKML